MSSPSRQLQALVKAVVILGGLSAAFWALMTFLPPNTARGFVGGSFVREANRAAGKWLRARSAPCASACGPEQEAASAPVEGMYSWTDEGGIAHYVEDPSQVPDRYRKGSKVESLPSLSTYSGAYSRLPSASSRGVKPAARIAPARGARAIVYSAAWCGACKDTKAFLKSLGVTVEERDIDKDPTAAAELAKIAGDDAGIPVTVLGGKVIGGFDEEALRTAAEGR